MGGAAKKKCAAEAKATCKAKKDTEKAIQPAEDPTSTEPTSSGAKLSNQSKKPRAAPQNKLPRVPSTGSTRRSTCLHSVPAAVSGKKTASANLNESIETHPHRSATIAAKVLLQKLQLDEAKSSDFEENPDSEFDDEDMGLEDGDGGTIGGDESESLSEVELVEGSDIGIGIRQGKGLAGASSASREVQKRASKIQVIKAEESSNTDTDEFETFEMTFEINDKVRGSCKNLTLSSLTPWSVLRDKIAQALNIHPESLKLQYRFSNEKNNTLPFNLSSHNDYIKMQDQLKPFVVPKILANSKPSKSARKLVTVQLFNKEGDDIPGPQAGGKEVGQTRQCQYPNSPG
ncbi:hypothetical protein BYT27DRAFT_7207641 [Phlegmacium glaucopus]|nr:hypothetical protein BYT27DRAFT_7207641 [Phlegmacium glaucopus]